MTSLSLFFVALHLLLTSSFGESRESCGLRKIKPRSNQQQLLVPTSYPGQFPWQVAIYHRVRRNQTNFLCAGSLISRRFVLTAGEFESDDLVVHMGLHDLETINWATFQLHSVEEVFRNDIALLKLAGRVQFSNYVQPVCLGSAEQFVGINGVFAGWGVPNGQDLRFLRSLTMTIKRKEDCLKSSGLFCAEGRNGAKICRNDIGGGLLVKQNDSWSLIGILSFVQSDFPDNVCLNEGSFTDIQNYLPWIGDVIGMNFVDRLGAKTCGLKLSGSQQWPWHGSLHRNDQDHPGESTYWCGVTILSEKFVLTVNLISVGNISLDQFYLKFGESRRLIEKVFPHSKKSLDLALIKTKTPLSFSPQLQPICLWQFDSSLEKIVNRVGYLVGYGSDRFDNSAQTLKELPMPIASANDCTRNHERFRRLYVESQSFCAGLRNGTGPDYGDTGGGLVLEDGGKWFLRGVLSRLIPTNDYDRALKTRYAIFADVTFYLSWIDGVLRDDSGL